MQMMKRKKLMPTTLMVLVSVVALGGLLLVNPGNTLLSKGGEAWAGSPVPGWRGNQRGRWRRRGRRGRPARGAAGAPATGAGTSAGYGARCGWGAGWRLGAPPGLQWPPHEAMCGENPHPLCSQLRFSGYPNEVSGWPRRNIHVRKQVMKCSLLFVLVSMMTACGIGVAHGKDCQGVNFPEQAQIDGSTLTPQRPRPASGDVLEGQRLCRRAVCNERLQRSARAARVEYSQGVDPPLPPQGQRRRPQEGLVGGLCAQRQGAAPGAAERIERLKSWMADMQSGHGQPSSTSRGRHAGGGERNSEGHDYRR